MRILVHSIFYRPDLTGVSKYTAEMCEWLAQRGHQITAIAPPPHYPEWRVRPPYRAWKYASEMLAGVRVWRSPLWVPRKPSGLRRVLYSLSFFLSSIPFALAAALRPPDVVLAVEPSLLSAISAWLTARLTGAALWLHIQDYEVDLAFDLGQLQRGRGIALKLESWLMRRFNVVSSITPRMLEKALAKGVAAERLFSLPNWFDPGAISPSTSATRFRDELKLRADDVVVLFAGSLGAKQGLEVLIAAARLTPAVTFLICGEGVMTPRLRTMAADLANVKFLPLQSSRYNEILNTADIHALPQDPAASGSVMPSKLIGMLASARPVVAGTAEGTEIAELIEGCGTRVNPGDAAALSRAITQLASDPAERRRLGEAGRQRALGNFRSDVILPSLESELIRLTRRKLPQAARPAAAK